MTLIKLSFTGELFIIHFPTIQIWQIDATKKHNWKGRGEEATLRPFFDNFVVMTGAPKILQTCPYEIDL